jgi:hypothetical protein
MISILKPKSIAMPKQAAGTSRHRSTRTLIAVAIALVASTAVAPWASAQPPVHYLLRADMPPGVIGTTQLQRGGPRGGYFQPVEVRGPEGTRIALATEGGFDAPRPGVVTAGMLIGHVYRMQVTGIQRQEGQEVYPTIEVIDRLYPPPGQATRHPIPIELTQEELEFAIDGRFVTRVIYVEDPNYALPIAQTPGTQPYFEVDSKQDPLEVADRIGRPVAILRMGSRIPTPEMSDNGFLYQPAPAYRYELPPGAPVPRNSGIEPPLEQADGPNALQYLRRVPQSQLQPWTR